MELKRIFCAVCGSNNLIEIGNIFKCNACDAQFEKQQDVSEEQVKLFSALYDAESFIRMAPPRFDFAEEKYRIIANDYPEEASAYWGLFRARNDIKYIEGKPICYNYVDKDVKNDPDYLNALKYADDKLKQRYKEEIEKIDLNIQEWKKRASELDYDVFLSFKQTDSDGKETEDTKLVRELYTFLLENNIKTFYSPYSMKNHIGEPYYDAYIYNALSKSQVLFIYGSDPKYFDSDWVKCEWTRYLNMISKKLKRDDSLLISFSEFDAEQLPRELRNRQAYNSNSRTMFNDIIFKIIDIIQNVKYEKNGIQRVDKPIIEKYNQTEFSQKIIKKVLSSKYIDSNVKNVMKKVPIREFGKVYISGKEEKNVDFKLGRTNAFIQADELEMAKIELETVLKEDSNNPIAILYELLIEFKCKNIEELLSQNEIIFNEKKFGKLKYVIEYSDFNIATSFFSKISNLVLFLIDSKKSEEAFTIYEKFVDYDSNVITELHEKTIIHILEINNFTNFDNNICNLSLDYLTGDIYKTKKYLCLLLEKLCNLSKYDDAKQFYGRYIEISSYDIIAAKYDLLINCKCTDLEKTFVFLAKNDELDFLENCFTKTSLESALELLNTLNEVIINCIKSSMLNESYNLLKISIQYDFNNKNDFLSYILKYVVFKADRDTEKIFDLIMSYFLENKSSKYKKDISIEFDDVNAIYSSKGNNKYYYLLKYKKDISSVIINENTKIIDVNAFKNEYFDIDIESKNESKFISIEDFNSLTKFNYVKINKYASTISDFFKRKKIIKLECALNMVDKFDLSDVEELIILDGDIIDKNSFKNCSNINTICLPNSINTIKEDAFIGFVNLKKVYYNGTIVDWLKISFGGYLSNPMYYANDFYLLNKDGLIDYNGNNYNLIDKICIPESIDSINSYQFCGFKNIKEVFIHNNVRNIGYAAFSGCKSIKTMSIPSTGSRHFGYIFGSYKYECSYSVSEQMKQRYYLPYFLREIEINSKLYTGNYNSYFSGCIFNTLVLNLPVRILERETFGNCQVENLVIPRSVSKVEFEGLPYGVRNLYFGGSIYDWKAISFDNYSNPMRNGGNFYYIDSNNKSNLKDIVVFKNKTYIKYTGPKEVLFDK